MTVQRSSHKRLLSNAVAVCVLASTCVAVAQEPAATELQKESPVVDRSETSEPGLDGEPRLKFSFSYTPWKEVLEWIAEESDLSFNLDYTPRGTLNLIDSDRLYTPRQALDEINGQLLARGYALVRRYKSLYILDLEAEADQKLIADMLDESKLEDLKKLGRFELAKITFPLQSFTTEEAVAQIENMIGPSGRIETAPLAQQLTVSDTGENLRRIKAVLDKVEQRVGSDGLRSFRLTHATGDDVLAVAKPLLGIALDSNESEDGAIRVSTDPKGKVVYATGVPGKVSLVEQIVKQVDQDAKITGSQEALEFLSHKVKRGDPQTVLRILETRLSGDSRVRMQVSADSIFAYCTLEQHRMIRATIAEVEQEPAEIAVIPLRRVDPIEAVALIERMFGVDGDEAPENAPIVDATFDPNRLIVNGNAAQLDKIRLLLERMGERFAANGNTSGPVTSVLPMSSEAAEKAIERLRQMYGDRVRVLQSPKASPLVRPVPRDEEADGTNQAKPNAEPESNVEPEVEAGAEIDNRVDARGDEKRFLYVTHPAPGPISKDKAEETSQAIEAGRNSKWTRPVVQPAPQSNAPEIIVMQTDEGLVIRSEDANAADNAEEMLMLQYGSVAGPKYHLFSIKHVKAEEAQTLLETLFTGGATDDAEGSARSGAMGLYASGGSSFGAPKMIADNRLNRLFVEGTRSQIRDVERYLKVIDVEEGTVEVQTNPKPTYIPVLNTTADSIVEILKSIYADRIYDPNQRNARQSGGRGGFPGFGGFGRGGGGDTQQTSTTTGEVAKMTIAADASSNLVIVVAPGPFVKEVQEVVKQLDSWAEAAPTEGYTIGQLQSSSSPTAVIKMLKDAYPDFIKTDGEMASATGGNGNSRTQGTTQTGGLDAQRRAAIGEAFRARFGGGGGFGGFGGRGGGGPGGGRGGATGGRGGGGGGRGGPGGGGRGGR